MSVLWILPLLFVATGALVLLAAVRQTAHAAAALRTECGRLDELRSSLAMLTSEADEVRSTLQGLRLRSEPGPTGS
ncbi:MAG TPA: hypothetical protein VGJ03_01930 [Acidimicrobiales bacterium]